MLVDGGRHDSAGKLQILAGFAAVLGSVKHGKEVSTAVGGMIPRPGTRVVNTGE